MMFRIILVSCLTVISLILLELNVELTQKLQAQQRIKLVQDYEKLHHISFDIDESHDLKPKAEDFKNKYYYVPLGPSIYEL